jgi:hypothetical protein
MKLVLAIVMLLRAAVAAADVWVDPALVIEAERALQGNGELSLLPTDLLCAKRVLQEPTKHGGTTGAREQRLPGNFSSAQQSLYVRCMIDETLTRGYEH